MLIKIAEVQGIIDRKKWMNSIHLIWRWIK